MSHASQALKRKSPSCETELDPIIQQPLPRSETEDQVQTIKSSSPDEQKQNKRVKSKTTPDKMRNHPKSIVELDKSKGTLLVKQKPIELCEVSNQVKKNLVAITEELESINSSLLDLSTRQTNFIGCLAHESDKTLSELTKYVHSKLLPQTKLLEDEHVQKPFDPLPLSVIESAITQVAVRINYAPTQAEIDWLPSHLPKCFQIWRWECNNREAVIPSDLNDISQKRWEERQLIKPQLCALLSGLNSSERVTLLKKLSPKRQGKSSVDEPTARATTQTPQTKVPNDSSEMKAVALGQSSKPSNNKKMSNSELPEKVPTEKELIKQQKDQKRKEKEDAKLAEEQQKKKMGNLMSGWMTKANATNKTNQSPSSNSQNVSTNTDGDSNASDGIEITAWLKNGIKQDTNKFTVSDFEKTFRPFNLKSHVHLAPINRFRLTSSNESGLKTNPLESSINLTPQECLHQFLKSVSAPSKSQSHSKPKMVTIREIVNGLAESELSGCIEGAKKWRRTLQNRSIVPVKFLRFHEDVRPGYVGTWCKTSRLVSGRNPFGKDTCLLDYDYDSEADWNEEDGEGEDLGQSDEGNEEGEGFSSELGDSDEDGWLVGDDDEIEMVDDGENHASNRALDLQIDDQSLSKVNKKIIGPTRRKIVGPLIPIVKGPIWEETLGVVSTNLFESFRIQMINEAPIGLNPFTYEPKTIAKINRPKLSTVSLKVCPAVLPLPDSSIMDEYTKSENNVTTYAATNKRDELIEKKEEQKTPQSSNQNNFPNELVPHLIKLVNGNRKSKPILLEDLKNEFLTIHPTLKISKRLIEQTLSRLAVKVSGTWRIIDSHHPS